MFDSEIPGLTFRLLSEHREVGYQLDKLSVPKRKDPSCVGKYLKKEHSQLRIGRSALQSNSVK